MNNRAKYVNASGNRYTKAIFYELAVDKSQVLYTLKDRDHKGFLSLYLLYMECGDLTEYTFANLYLEGWEHWKILCECSWFQPYVARWREELHLKHAALALIQVKRIAAGAETSSLTANKYLLEKGWKKTLEPVGRPTKEAIKRKAKEMVLTQEEINEDHKRIFN